MKQLLTLGRPLNPIAASLTAAVLLTGTLVCLQHVSAQTASPTARLAASSACSSPEMASANFALPGTPEHPQFTLDYRLPTFDIGINDPAIVIPLAAYEPHSLPSTPNIQASFSGIYKVTGGPGIWTSLNLHSLASDPVRCGPLVPLGGRTNRDQRQLFAASFDPALIQRNGTGSYVLAIGVVYGGDVNYTEYLYIHIQVVDRAATIGSPWQWYSNTTWVGDLTAATHQRMPTRVDIESPRTASVTLESTIDYLGKIPTSATLHSSIVNSAVGGPSPAAPPLPPSFSILGILANASYALPQNPPGPTAKLAEKMTVSNADASATVRHYSVAVGRYIVDNTVTAVLNGKQITNYGAGYAYTLYANPGIPTYVNGSPLAGNGTNTLSVPSDQQAILKFRRVHSDVLDLENTGVSYQLSVCKTTPTCSQTAAAYFVTEPADTAPTGGAYPITLPTLLPGTYYASIKASFAINNNKNENTAAFFGDARAAGVLTVTPAGPAAPLSNGPTIEPYVWINDLSAHQEQPIPSTGATSLGNISQPSAAPDWFALPAGHKVQLLPSINENPLNFPLAFKDIYGNQAQAFPAIVNSLSFQIDSSGTTCPAGNAPQQSWLMYHYQRSSSHYPSEIAPLDSSTDTSNTAILDWIVTPSHAGSGASTTQLCNLSPILQQNAGVLPIFTMAYTVRVQVTYRLQFSPIGTVRSASSSPMVTCAAQSDGTYGPGSAFYFPNGGGSFPYATALTIVPNACDARTLDMSTTKPMTPGYVFSNPTAAGIRTATATLSLKATLHYHLILTQETPAWAAPTP